MKRRDFILSSLLAVCGTTLLTGCGKKEIIKAQGQVAKRKFHNLEIPLLGFGLMRLPMINSKIDMIELDKMVEYAMSHGANYFDTAYMYVDSESENAAGKILSNYDRKSYFLADKSPVIHMRKKEDIHRIFQEQLKKCRTDYFDFYMVHNINRITFDTYRNLDMFNELMKYKEEGKIKYLGFSFHGTPEMLKEVAPEHPWDFAKLQINYFDWDIINAKEQYDIVQKENIPVIVMEPLRGGGLCQLSDKALSVINGMNPPQTPASLGLRWAASRNNVITVLSGMSNLKQMKENIATFENYSPVSEEEELAAKEIVKIIQEQGEINCTACKYCLEVCPKNINIPAAFSVYNNYKKNNESSFFAMYYSTIDENQRPDKCIKCNLCNTNCPQGLNIPKLLSKVDQTYKDILSKKST